MATTQETKIQLSNIHRQLISMPVFSSGRPDDDATADNVARQLESILNRLEILLRDLKSQAHFAQAQLNQARKLPREDRWSAQASAQDKRRNAEEVSAEAESLIELVKDLLKRNGLLSPMQAGKRAIDLFQDLEKHLPQQTHASVQQPVNRPAFTAPDSGAPQFESVIPLITLLYVAIKYWKESISKKGRPSI